MPYWIVVLFSLVACCADAIGAAPDLQVRFPHYYADYVVEADGTVVERHEWSKTVLKETALEASKRASVSYSHSAQKAEVIEAYTRKADGRRIDVPPNNYQQEVNSGRDGASPLYSDWATLTVVFPDVAVGDTVVFAYRLKQTEPMFPGHFSVAQQFYRHIAYDDIRIRFDFPENLWIQHQAKDMKEQVTTANGRRLIEWSFANSQPVKSDRRDYSVFDPEKEAGYAVSTFRNYAEISTAYGVRALLKAEVTDRIAKLAADIVTGKNGKREEARALYEWVATNITYAGNCIGIGAVVPRDTDFVLDNKMGDCKDHATLLQALLSARGIKSTQALINAGAGYRLQKIPVAANVNHVINYLPEFKLFADSTSNSTPFGMLPYAAQDKPVLLVEEFKEGAKTPVTPYSQNKQVLRSHFKVADDGSISGKLEVEQVGSSAVGTREWARHLSKDFEADLVKNFFRNQGVIGSGEFKKDDPTQLIDTYRYQASFNAEKFLKPRGAGGFHVAPVPAIASTILSGMQASTEPETLADVTCSGGTMIEEYVIELPKGRKILALPENAKVSNRWLSYQASYRTRGNKLIVRRELEDRTPGNVCSPEMMGEFKEAASKVLDNLKEQVLYQ